MTGAETRPSPHRDRASPWLLTAAVGAGPVAWVAQEILLYAVATYPCFPGREPRTTPLQGWEHSVWILPLANLAALAVALAAAWFCLRTWRATQHEKDGDEAETFEIGEGRTRFMALSGVITNLGFAVAVLFLGYPLMVVGRCPV